MLPGVLAGSLAFACAGHDTSYLDPSAVDINPPGFGGNAGHLDSNAGAAGDNEAGSSSGGEAGAAEGGAAGTAEGGAAGTAEGGAAGTAEGGAAGTAEGGAAGTGEEPDGGTGEQPDGGTGIPPIDCTIDFVTPSLADLPLTFGPSDDQDGTACGSGFTTSVVVSSSGVSVQLFVDGTPWATENVTAATSLFEGVVIGSRTPATTTLRAVASMGDGRSCEATLGQIGVDCAGPSCVLAGPNQLGALGGSDDTDAVATGLQTSFTVQTDAENSGEDVHLILNGDENALLTQSADNNGSATFAPVTLAEGPTRTVQAECRDTLGNVTRSSVSTWSVALDACDVEFVTPDSTSDPITLGPNDDQDGDPCGAEVRTSVDVSTNATSLTLLVDDQPVDTVQAASGAAHFSSVLLGTRFPVASTLKVQATMADGRTCQATRSSLMVDCEGPTCTLVGPSQSATLNATDDLDAAADLQANFSVTTGSDNAGEPVRLIVNDDANNPLNGLFADDNGTMSAAFDLVTLPEGSVRHVQAECEDALGNITHSTIATYAVDITPCSISIGSVAGGANPITRAIDEANLVSDIQVTALGAVIGNDCTGVRAGVCSQPLGTFTSSIDQNGDWSQQVTLADLSASGQVCAQVQDAAGNIAQISIPVTVRSNDPVVAFSTPAADANINIAGGPGLIADATPATTTCEATFVVDCTEVGSNVDLFVDSTKVDSQLCQGVGQATFNVSLVSKNGGEKYSLTAAQIVAGLTGTSPAIHIGADCDPPVPTFANSLCNSQLNLDTDDALPASGLQHDVTVNNAGIALVDLSVQTTGGTVPLQATGDAISTTFTNVNFGDPGSVTLSATVTDPQGNLGTVSCQVLVVEAPSVDILVPAAPVSPATATLLSTADDCDTGSGYGITVSGTTSAVAGSTIDVDIDGGAPFAFADVADGGGGPNTFTGCLPISDGIQQTVTVTIDDGVNPTGSDSTAVTVDTLGPSDPVLAPSVLISASNRRPGIAQFTWSHVNDTGGGTLASYEMRCASSQILTETDWTNARVLALSTTPAHAGDADAVELVTGGFRVGTTENCVIRGRDDINELTPLAGAGGNAVVNPTFTQTDFTTVPDASSSFISVAGLGDINGDGSDDMIYGGINLGARIFFGGSASHPFDTTPDITINGLATGAFGAVIGSVGDINGDSIPDFAVSARTQTTPAGANSGTVYVFFGKSDAAWGTTSGPVTINVTTGGCNADVCLVGSTAAALFGWDFTGTNFDGSGATDLVISARQHNNGTAGAGRVYVLLGGSQFNVAHGTSISVPSGAPNGFFIDPPSGRSDFGVAVAAVGTGPDTKGDLAIGASGRVGMASTNLAALFYLRGEAYSGSGLIAPSASSPAEVATGSSGDYATPVRAIGDFDGDGLADLALGRNYSAGGGFGEAQLYLRNDNHALPTDFTAGSGFIFSFPATTTDNDFGTFIASGLHPSLGTIGDLDNDGATELLVGSLSPSGRAGLFYGPRLVTVGTPRVVTGRSRANADFTLSGASTNSVMVTNFVGDIDHDGFNDVAILDGGTDLVVPDKLILLH